MGKDTRKFEGCRAGGWRVNVILFVAVWCLQGEAGAQTALGVTNLPPNTSVLLLSTNLLDNRHKLSAGDRVSFRILEDEEEPRRLEVTDSGDLDVPYLGRVPAVDKTCRQLAHEIELKLEQTYYYQATVWIAVDQLNPSRGKVYLAGYVRAPGAQDIPSDETFTLSKAIMRAGGFHEFADERKVRVTRKAAAGEAARKAIEVDVRAVLEQGRTDRDILLEPGDLIYVPSRLFKF